MDKSIYGFRLEEGLSTVSTRLGSLQNAGREAWEGKIPAFIPARFQADPEAAVCGAARAAGAGAAFLQRGLQAPAAEGDRGSLPGEEKEGGVRTGRGAPVREGYAGGDKVLNIGYDCFQKTIRHVDPKYVSCIIQINIEDTWVSDSPYLHVFDGLEQVHYQMEERELEKAMLEVNYHVIRTLEHMLPNGKN